jgi:hypothetical protein
MGRRRGGVGTSPWIDPARRHQSQKLSKKETMMRLRTLAPLSALLLCTLPAASFAGAGANVYACIYLPTAPIAPMVANVTAGGSGTHCMNDTGNNTTINVTSVGLNCSSVGYVEAKASSTKGDTCATDSSTWPLSYNISGTAYSGSTQSTWSGAGTRNSVELNNPSQNTSVCNAQSLCTGTSATWNHGTQGPLYFVFQPLSH